MTDTVTIRRADGSRRHILNKHDPAEVLAYAVKVISYDPETGVFIWKRNTSMKRRGDEAGHIDHNGYRRIFVGGHRFAAHRLAWLIHYGAFPENHIDHINGDQSDNRICNLRSVTHAENHQNTTLRITNSSGFIGASRHKSTGKWRASIRANGKSLHLGSFDTAEEAGTAYLAAKQKYHTVNPVPRSGGAK